MRTIMLPKTSSSSSSSSSSSKRSLKDEDEEEDVKMLAAAKGRTSTAHDAISRLRSALSAVMAAGRRRRPGGLGSRVTGTLFGRRRGHVRLAFQTDARAPPALVLELSTPTCVLVREMASGLVRIALECDNTNPRANPNAAAARPLVEEPLWRAYCNGKKCGYAARREVGGEDSEVLRAVENVTMGAGVLPLGGGEGEVMYMRARFERVVGNKDSEAFYMMSPDGGGSAGGNGGPELSIYLLRV